MSRELKFKVYKGSELIGIEQLGKYGWEWMVYAINPDKGERWTPGSLPASKYYVRCQFTGLKDKNRKEIYEGDIIRYDLRAGLGEPEIKYKKREVKFYVTGYFSSYDENIEVIGNIHQNPELL